MQLNNEFFLPFLAAMAGAVIFRLFAGLFFRSFSFDLGRGSYVGGLPQTGALTGILLSYGISDMPAGTYEIVVWVILLNIIGLARDLKKISEQMLTVLSLLTFSSYFAFSAMQPHSVLPATLWVFIIFGSLKVASLVYEMPFVLSATSSLTMAVYFSQKPHSAESFLLTLAVLACSIFFLVYSSGKKRILTGNGGLLVTGFLLSLVSLAENSGKLIFIAVLLPSMVIFFPFALISLMLIFSYFGNKLHLSPAHERSYKWSLERERLVVFSGLVFLCLNFLLLLVEVKAPVFGYLALFILLIASMIAFFKAFARKEAQEFPESAEIEILGVKIAALKPEEVVNKISRQCQNHQATGLYHVITADSLALLRSIKDKRFKNVISRAELVIPDGAGIVWASDFLGTPLPARVPGVALVVDLCRMCARENLKVFFLGGKPGIAKKAADKILKKYPQLQIAGIRDGYFRPESSEEDDLIKEINESKADILFVALGVPRQEWFISRMRPAIRKCVAIGVGGSFDVISETLPRAPEWMQRFGLEWLFRLWLEPFRIGRILKIPAFVLQVLRSKMNRNAGR
ncbi:MAG: hypothetical protein Kow0029_22320 [Candidatus Rifleibacteriota bacterium]